MSIEDDKDAFRPLRAEDDKDAFRLLRAAGIAMYGPLWQSQIARDLGLSNRTVRRWVSDASMPSRYLEDLGMLACQRVIELNRACDNIERRIMEEPK